VETALLVASATCW